MSPLQRPVSINVDLGEGYGNFRCGPDDELLPLIDLANVACGGHAGDPLIMAETVRACKKHNVKIGAHPGLPDVQGFGRRAMAMQPEELTAMVRYQVGALKAFLEHEEVPLNHVKPHGALYGMMYKDREVCKAVYAGVPTGISVLGLPGTIHEEVAREMGIPFVAEIYGDVKYDAEGRLIIDRKKSKWSQEELRKHVSSQLEDSSVRAVTGEKVNLVIGDYDISICCHSDSPGAVDIVKTAREMVDDFNARFHSR